MKVLIIGGGLIGAVIAYKLADEGVKTTLLEARFYTYGSTGRSTGSLTAQQRKPELVREALESMELLQEVKRVGCEERVPFACRMMDDESPHIAVARNEEEFDELRELASVWREGGAEVIEYRDPNRLMDLLPILNTLRIYGAYVTPKDLKVMPHPLTWNYIALARLRGAETHTKAKVTSLRIRNDSVEAITEDGRKFKSDAVVIAGGAASLKFVKELGEELRTEVTPRAAAGFVTEPFKYKHKPTVRVFRESYRFLQTVRSEYVVTIDDLGWGNTELSVEDNLDFLIKASKITVDLLPSMEYVNVLRAWGAYNDFTADGYPVIGWSRKYNGKIYYAFGFNDYGLSAGQSIAEKAAEEIVKGTEEPGLSKFRP